MTSLILFDIDKTLIKSSTGHRASFAAAFKKVYGVATNIGIINPSGMTDQQIIIEVLKKNGLAEKAIKAKINKCMIAMVDFYVKNSKKDKVVLSDNAEETLDCLFQNGHILGLVTGNLEPIAWSKLKKTGIDKYFTVGGFGSDDIDRANLVKLAVKRAMDKFHFKPKNVFLVGDAPQDMDAGKKAGIEAVGITTGIYTKEELEKAGADCIIENLRELLEIV